MSLLCSALALAACAGATPSGFSKGDHWTFPLVGPLEDGVLLTPVTVRGHGPYVFAIDPDASISAIDKQVADEAGLETEQGPTQVDETGAEGSRGYAVLTELQIGTLAIERRHVMLVPTTFYNTEGRQVNGVLGRDVLAEGLVFGFDRDQGIATLATPKAFAPPPGGIAIEYRLVQPDPGAVAHAGRGMVPSSNDDTSRIGVITHNSGPAIDAAPQPRRVASAQIAGRAFTMHLDLGGPVSQLREALWAKAKLAPVSIRRRLVDEAAAVREVTEGVVAEVSVGGARAARVTLAPYVDRRFAAETVDGALGLDFFRPYAVYASWGTRTLHLKARGDAAATATARLGRWGAAVPSCPHPGCVTVTLTDTPGGTKLDVVRDKEAAGRALELWLGVAPAAGKTPAPLVVELPAKIDTISGGIDADYAGATLTVLDASPFTRSCAEGAGCVFQLDAPAAQRAE